MAKLTENNMRHEGRAGRLIMKERIGWILFAAVLLIAANYPVDLPWTTELRYSRAGVQYDVNRTSCATAATTTLEASPGGSVPAVFGFGSLVIIGSDAAVGFTISQWPDTDLGDQTTESAFLATTTVGSASGRATGSPIYATEKRELVIEAGQIRNKPHLYSGRYCSVRLSAANSPGGDRVYPPCNQNSDCTGSGAGQFNLAGAVCSTRDVLAAAANRNVDSWESANGGVIIRVGNDSGGTALVDWDLSR
jgi:hypothetical protein